jgi:hypothetical protein
VHVSKVGKYALNHLVDEPVWAIELDDLRCQPLPNTEMYGLERDDVTGTEESERQFADDAFACKRGGPEMRLYIAGQVEAAFDGRSDACFDDDRRHLHEHRTRAPSREVGEVSP